jgi:glycine/D-amino acid oxidase-like deaminating enzyme
MNKSSTAVIKVSEKAMKAKMIPVDIVIVGGEDHREEIKMSEAKNFKALEKYVKEIMQNKPYSITGRWTGPILEPSDGIALMGKTGDHSYIATAFSGNGMTYSTIAGMIMRDLILGKKNP